MPTTRADLKKRIRLFLAETFDTDGGDDPFSLDYMLTDAANRIARATDCNFVDSMSAAIVSGQGRYCFPDMYRVQSVLLTLSGTPATKQITPQSSLSYLDSRFPEWREDPDDGDPDAVVFAEPDLYLYPVPDYNAAAGIVLRGWAQPGDSWPLDTDNFPLTDRALEACFWDVCQQRAAQFNDWNKAAHAERMAREERGRLEAETATNYDRASNQGAGRRRWWV